MSKWENKTVLVTGGSAGLGLAIAMAFAKQGADIVIVGRDMGRLRTAAAKLEQFDSKVLTIKADVTNETEARQVFEKTEAEFGQLHVLVNAVGKSVRTDFGSVDLGHYREFMDVNLYSAISCTSCALRLLEKVSGHVVNIGSLSSKTAWPYMAPYTTSKFALAGYTQQLRLEGPSNVHAMLVCPGPIKRDDGGVRYNAQSENVPEAALQPGAGVKLKGLDPDRVARAIVKGCEKRKPEIIMPFKPKLLFILSAISSRLGDWLLRKIS